MTRLAMFGAGACVGLLLSIIGALWMVPGHEADVASVADELGTGLDSYLPTGWRVTDFPTTNESAKSPGVYIRGGWI